MKMRQLLIRLLMRLIDRTTTYKFDSRKINKWLAENHMDVRFHAYYAKRDLTLLQLMGQGLGEKQYQLVLGQRIELIRLKQMSKKAYVIEQKQKEELKKRSR